MAVPDIFFLLLDAASAPTSEVAAAYIAQADALILGYLGLSTLPVSASIDQARAMLAVVLYNRRGTEGELKRAEGDVASWFEQLPDIIRVQLRPFRTVRAVSWPSATV